MRRDPGRWRRGPPRGDAAHDINVGRCMRSLRVNQGYSLRALADRCGLAVNTLSLIENGKVSPSVSTLQRVALTLGVPMTAFFEAEPSVSEVAHLSAGRRHRLEFAHGLMEDLGLGMAGRTLEPFLLTLDPHADSGPAPIVHTGQEFVFCLEGILHYAIDDQLYELQPGDSLLFEASLPHRWANRAPEPSKALLVLCPLGGPGRPAMRHFGIPRALDEVPPRDR